MNESYSLNIYSETTNGGGIHLITINGRPFLIIDDSRLGKFLTSYIISVLRDTEIIEEDFDIDYNYIMCRIKYTVHWNSDAINNQEIRTTFDWPP